MIILLQSVTTQFLRLFCHIWYCKKQQKIIIKCERLLLQSASGITKCDRLYYKVRQAIQSVTVITKRDVTPVPPYQWVVVLKDSRHLRLNWNYLGGRLTRFDNLIRITTISEFVLLK